MKIRTGPVIAVIAASTVIGQDADVYHQGSEVFQAKCQTCHGTTGVPTAEVTKYVGVRPVTDPEVKDMSKERMIDITKKGLGKMPAFKHTLTDTQIRDAVTYFRTLGK